MPSQSYAYRTRKRSNSRFSEAAWSPVQLVETLRRRSLLPTLWHLSIPFRKQQKQYAGHFERLRHFFKHPETAARTTIRNALRSSKGIIDVQSSKGTSGRSAAHRTGGLEEKVPGRLALCIQYKIGGQASRTHPAEVAGQHATRSLTDKK